MTISNYDKEHIGDIVAGHGTWMSAQLIRLIAKADVIYLERFRLAFPEHVEAFERWKYAGHE